MPAPRKYSAELRQRAVRMVRQIEAESGTDRGVVAGVAAKLGINRETLRLWVRQARIDAGAQPGTSSEDARRIAELERELKDLRRANEILRVASVFFARELDLRPPR
jgi:transposase